MERQHEHSGYPSMDTTARSREGDGGGTLGHRVLCLDMPDDVWATNARVMRLPEDLRQAVELVFVVVMKTPGTGELWTFAEKCSRLSLSQHVVRRRLNRAMYLIAGLAQPEFL